MGATLDTRPGLLAQPRWSAWWDRLMDLTQQPQRATRLLWGCWAVSRVALLLMVIVGHAYCDTQFYHYAGELASGRWPYRDISVEYPPLALVLILLPALPLLAFPAIAPRHDLAFTRPLTHLPQPDLARYGPYAISFAVEMLLLDALTLLLVTWAARRLVKGDRMGVRSGLLYTVATLACGALLQKFDLAAGACMLLAVALLVAGRPRLAWAALAVATLIKGFPLLAAPLFVAYALLAADTAVLPGSSWWERLHQRYRATRAQLLGGIATLVGIIAAGALPIALVAGWGALLGPLQLQGQRATEIESLYGTAMLVVSWLPGLGVSTTFSETDLSRVVVSPLNSYLDTLYLPLVIALALLALTYAMFAWAVLPVLRSGRLLVKASALPLPQMLVAGVVAALLAFMLTFRALPLHYLLIVLPLAAVLRLPSRRLTIMLWIVVGLVAILGQYLTIMPVWNALKLLQPWAVGVLTLRNLAWIAAYVVVIAALYQWRAAFVQTFGWGEGARMGTVATPPKPRPRIAAPTNRRLLGAWRRLVRSTPPIPGFTPRGEDVVAHLLSRISPLTVVVAAGLVSALIYLGFVAAFPITTWWSHPRLAIEMGRLTDYSPVAAATYVIAIAALFICQFLTLGAAGRLPQIARPTERTARLARRAVLIFPVVFVVILIWMQPITTTDLYGYVARGYLFAHLHLNPMLAPATALPGGLHVDRPASPYGPLWLLMCAGVSRLAGENLLANMLLFKLIAALAAVAAMALVDALARRLFPTRRLRIYVLFAWSPLLLFEAIGNGHNDSVMMLCVLLAFALMLRGRARTAFAFLVLGGLIKYVSLVLVPLWLVYELRQRASITMQIEPQRTPRFHRVEQRTTSSLCVLPVLSVLSAVNSGRARIAAQMRATVRMLQTMNRREASVLLVSAAVTAGVLFAVCYAPFWAGMRTFTGLGQQLRPLYYNSSIVQFVTAPLELIIPTKQYAALDKTVRLVFYIAFAAYAFLQTRRLWLLGAQATMRDVITASAKVIFAALLLITFWFQPWYIVWLLPLAALAQQSFVRRQSTVLAAGALLTYAISNFLPVGTSGIGRDLFVQFFEVLVTFSPLLLLRVAPSEEGWSRVVRRYAHQVSEGLRIHPRWWERVMLALILIVAALLRVLRLGNPFAVVSTGSSGALQELGADLKLYLADPRGLHGPFVALQGVMLHFFGRTPLAILLPSAIIGTLTVFVIYLLALEVTRQGHPDGQRGVALLAALFAATSAWHVSLSRSGMEVVLLPLLICTGIYWLLLALRLNAARIAAASTPLTNPAAQPATDPVAAAQPAAENETTEITEFTEKPRESSRPLSSSLLLSVRSVGSVVQSSSGIWIRDRPRAGGPESERRCLLLLAGCGIATGLASDIAPGLWLLPLLVAGILIVWRWRRPQWFVRLRVGLLTLFSTAVVTGGPAIWTLLSTAVGFPKGSPYLARSTAPMLRLPDLRSHVFWQQVAKNASGVLHTLVAQDYSAGYPANGGTPILPAGLGWLFFLGMALILVRWRDMTSLALLLLVALPVVASVAVGAPAAVVEAAAVLPATCIVPALALRTLAGLFGHLPIALDRINGVRVFSSPEQIGRVLLLIFLLIATVRTFFWYFAATLPSTPPNQWIPT